MKKSITNDDIIIYDKLIKDDTRNAGYNIGDLLNMPSLHNIWTQCPHADNNILNRMNIISNNYENSILNIYCKIRQNKNEIIPNIDKIKKSVEEFTNKNQHTYSDILQVIQLPTTLCIHIRNADVETEESYINCIDKIAKKYKDIILLTGIHNDESYRNNNNKIINVIKIINLILQKNNNINIYLNTADIHLSLMMYASNLLIHKGGFSCLGSIVSTGNLFITKLFTYVNQINWQTQVNKKYTLIE